MLRFRSHGQTDGSCSLLTLLSLTVITFFVEGLPQYFIENRILNSRVRRDCTDDHAVRGSVLPDAPVAELEASLPSTCKVIFPDENKLLSFQLDVSPDEGYYQSGTFQFEINVPEAYNMVPPKAKCLTQIWHPNITEAGGICLSILREHSTDGTGWAQTRTLKDVVWGLNSLFTEDFCDKVQDFINRYAR